MKNTLKTNDRDQISVIIARDAPPAENFAAAELGRYLKAATGKNIPLLNAPPEKGLKCVVGALAGRFLPDHDKNKAKLKHDGFIIHFDGDKLLILGNNPRGTLNGVYALLEELGFRWVYPKKGEEIIPELKTISIRKGTRIINPELELRGVCIIPVVAENVEQLRRTIDWTGKNRFNLLMTSVSRTIKSKNGWRVEWQSVGDKLLPEILKRGIILDMSEHAGRFFFPTSLFEKHPEWFALNAEGKRFSTGQICYSNEEAAAVLAENYAKYAKDHPEVDIIGTWPEDGYGFCQCAKCKQPGTVLKTINIIAEKIESVRPDLTVEYLSYTKETSDVPPDILPRHNMAILIANPRVAGEWLKKSDAVGGRGIYQLNYRIADNSAARANLPLRFEKTREDCLKAKAIQSRGIIPFYIGLGTWWRSSLNLYFLGRAAWDSAQSSGEILEDFCRKYFKNASVEMAALFAELEKMPLVNQGTPPPWPLWQEWPTLKSDFTGQKAEEIAAVFTKLRSLLQAARKKAGKTAEMIRRFNAVEAFIDFQETLFASWRERALAVAAFEKNDASEVRRRIIGAARHEQRLAELRDQSEKKDDGVNEAGPDFDFFQNWRLQLDKQLLEMRTTERKKPFIDNNPDVEKFLPALLGL